jgi:hypothetical protein
MRAALLLIGLMVAGNTGAQTTDTSRFFKWYDYNFTEPEEFVIKNILVEESDNKPIQKSLVVV